MSKCAYENQKLIVLSSSQVNFLREYLNCLSHQCKFFDNMEKNFTLQIPEHITNEHYSLIGAMVDSILKELY